MAQAQDKEEQEEVKSADISLPHAVVYPGAVVVVLLHAHFADVAVVPPSRHKVLAIEAHLLQILLALLPYKFVVVLDLPSRRPGKQGEVKYEHGGEEDDL